MVSIEGMGRLQRVRLSVRGCGSWFTQIAWSPKETNEPQESDDPSGGVEASLVERSSRITDCLARVYGRMAVRSPQRHRMYHALLRLAGSYASQ